MASFIDSKILIFFAFLTFYITVAQATTTYHHHHQVHHHQVHHHHVQTTHHHHVVVVSGSSSKTVGHSANAMANAKRTIASAHADATAKAVAQTNAAVHKAAKIPCPPPPRPAVRPQTPAVRPQTPAVRPQTPAIRPQTPAVRPRPTPGNRQPLTSVSPGAERNDFLKAHNKVRAMMHEPEFTWDTKLEQYARNYGANRVGDCCMIHSNGPYGENLFEGGGNAWTAHDAVAKWLDEVKSYDMGHNSCQKGKMCGHYTQIIWKNSCRLGCARIVCKNGDTFAICEYDPPGNYVHEKPLDGIKHKSQL